MTGCSPLYGALSGDPGQRPLWVDLGRMAARVSPTGADRSRVDGQDSELAAEELAFGVHPARFVPVNSIL